MRNWARDKPHSLDSELHANPSAAVALFGDQIA